MRNSKKVWICIIAVSLLFTQFLSVARADVQTGLDYLKSAQGESGAWERMETSLNGVNPTTATALDVLQLLEDPASQNQDSAVLYLVNQTIQVNDHLSRLISSLVNTDENISDALTTVLARQNQDGGWGGTEAYQSNCLDTALALYALNAANHQDDTITGNAINFLLDAQNDDGGWGFAQNGQSRPYYTAVVLQSIAAYKGQYPVQDQIDPAVQFLRAQPNENGGFGEWGSRAFETALVLLALIEAEVEPTTVEVSALEFIENTQLTNGSWEDDPYSTALALMVLHKNLAASLPNLTINNFTVSNSNPPLGATITITGEICNIGKDAAQNSVTRFFLGDPRENGRQIGSDQVIAELVGSGCGNVSVELDTDGLEGSQNIFVYVDPDDAILESSNYDNLGTTIFHMESGSSVANVAPTFSSSPVTSAAEGVLYTYDIDAIDINGDPLTFSLTQGALGMTLDTNSGLLTWTPFWYHVGDVPITVQVSDGRGGTATQAFTLTVAGANEAPGFTSVPGFSANVGELYTYQAAASDPNGDSLHYYLIQGPLGMRINSETGLVTWTPVDGQQGPNNVIVQVVDDNGGEEQQGFGILVPSGEAGPDLVPVQVDARAVITDSQSLAATGAVTVTVGNAGTEDVGLDFDLLLFTDENRNASYDNGVDAVLGQTTVSGLAAGELKTIPVDVSGMVHFRDDLIYVFVDSGDQVAESSETNNQLHSGKTSEFHPKPGPFAPKLEWAWTGSDIMPEHDDVMMTPLVINLTDDNGDGSIDQNDIPDVVFVSANPQDEGAGGVLRAVSGKDGTELWSASGSLTHPYASIAAGDLDGDGIVEIVARSNIYDKYILIFEHDGSLKQTGDPSIIGPITIADMEGDGSPEIIIGDRVFNSDASLRFKGSKGMPGGGFDGLTGLKTAPVSTVADLDEDGQLELICGVVAYRADGSIYYDVSDDPLLWDQFTHFGSGGYSAVGNFDDDPMPEVVASAGAVALLDHDGNLMVDQEGNIIPPTMGYNLMGPAAIGDVDGDGKAEIGIGARDFYYVFNHDLSLLWKFPVNDSSSGIVGASFFDFEGDGSVEVIHADENYLRVFRGNDGTVLFQIPNPSGTFMEYPVVADVDNDGKAEIVVCRNQFGDFGQRTGTNDSGIFVFGDQLDRWVGTRRIWNQHGYAITNVNENGTIPQSVVPNWQVFNNHRCNQMSPDEDKGPFSVPDLTASLIRVDQADCPTGAEITTRIGNGGGDMVPAGVKVSVYDGNPDIGAALIGTVETGNSLAPGDYEDVSLTFSNPDSGLHLITAVVDDMGGPLLLNSMNLVNWPGAQLSDYDNFSTPEFALDGLLATIAQTKFDGGKPAFIEIRFNQPVNISQFSMSIYLYNQTEDDALQGTTVTLSNGFSVPLSAAPALLFSSPFSVQENITSLKVNISGDLTENSYGIKEFLVAGTYIDQDGRKGEISEGREDNNRAIFSTTICGNPPAGNLAPEILSAPITAAVQAIPYVYDMVATDRDGDTLQYNLSVAPDGMTIDPATGRIQWTPAAFQSGIFHVLVEVSDGQGGQVSQEFTVTVATINNPPVITSAPPADAIQIGEVYTYAVEAYDPEGTQLQYLLVDSPVGMHINQQNGLITWRPTVSQVGQHDVQIAVTDLGGASTEQYYSMTVYSNVEGQDLIVSEMNNELSVTDAQSLELSGYVAVTIGNAGDTDVTENFDILLFADENDNGTYDDGIDLVLGSSTQSGGLSAGEYVIHDIEVSGTVLFRDNLIYAFVDGYDIVAEANEMNNIANSGESSRMGFLPGSFSPTVEIEYRNPYNTYTMRHTPLVVNLTDDNEDGSVDEDDVPELVFVDAQGRMIAVSGDTGEELWKTATYLLPYDYDIPAAGDIDGDGLPEIVVISLSSKKIIALEHDGQIKYSQSLSLPTSLLSMRAPAQIANIDRQGAPEILFANVILDADGILQCQGTGGQGLRDVYRWRNIEGYISTTVDLDLEGEMELLAGNTAYRSDCSIVWQNTAVPDGWTSVGNLDDDPYPEIVLIDQNDPDNRIWVLEHDGSLKYGPIVPPGGGSIAGMPVIADFDGDNEAEIGIAANQATVFESDLSVLWTVPGWYCGAASAFDFNGDGQAEMLVSGRYPNSNFTILRGTDGAVIFQTPMSGALAMAYPVAADLDNDGKAEVVVMHGNGFDVFGDAKGNWLDARSIWNQYTYHVSNVNDDGTIPVAEPDNGTLYNSFLQNTSFDLAPDMTASLITVDQSNCPDSVDISVRIGNGGGNVAPAGIPVVFYDKSPASTTEEAIGTVYTTRSLSAGEYEDVSLSLDNFSQGVHGIRVTADLRTEFENLTQLEGTFVTVNWSVNGTPGNQLIDGSTLSYVCAYNASHTPPGYFQVEFPYPVDVSGISLLRGSGTSSYPSGLLEFSNGFELPVTLTDGGGTFTVPLQEGITSIRFTGDEDGCLSEIIVAGSVSTIPETSGTLSAIDRALVGHWTLDENGLDSSWRGNHATVNGNPESVAGLDSPAFKFDGENDYLIKEDFNDFPTNDFTVSFWIKTSDTTRRGTILSYATSEHDDALMIGDYQNFRLCSENCYDSGVSANDGQWHHIAITWTDFFFRLYKDGVWQWTSTYATQPRLTGGTMVIGQDQDVMGGGFQTSEAFLGILDDVKVFYRSLTADEILAEYNRRKPGGWRDGSSVAEGREDNNTTFLAADLCGGSANTPPVVTSIPLTSAQTDVLYTYQLESDDPDGDVLAFSLLIAPAGMTMEPDTGLIQWTPTADQTGNHTVSIQVGDGQGGLDLQTYVLTVTQPTSELPEGDVDEDGDGFPIPADCDDTNPDVNPAAIEIPGNGIDDDCNPATLDAVVVGGLACSVETDKDTYTSNQEVQITATIQNTTAMQTFVSPRYGISVKDSNETVLLFEEKNGKDLAGGASAVITSIFSTGLYPPGNYTVTIEVFIGVELATTCSSTFTIESSATTGTAFEGSIEASPTQFNEGLSTMLTYSITNTGNVNIDGAQITIDVVRLTTQEVMTQFTDTITLQKGQTATGNKQFTTNMSSAGDYAAVIYTQGTADQVIDGATFTVLSVNQSPVANAGTDQVLSQITIVTLDGSQSSDPDGDSLNFIWRFESTPAVSTLTNVDITGSNSDQPSFTPDVKGNYVLELTVSDGEFENSDTVVVELLNQTPVADAGDDLETYIYTLVQLDGSQSSDSDKDPLTYSWHFESVPNGSDLKEDDIAGIATPQPSFIPDVKGTYLLQLTVSDGGIEATDTVVVTVLNSAPVADAGEDYQASIGVVVQLDGSNSADPDNDPLTFSWQFDSIPAESSLNGSDIIGSDTATPSFVPDVNGEYTLRLTVSDGELENSDVVIITCDNLPPVAVAGDDQNVETGTLVTLDGHNSYDPDGNLITYAWTIEWSLEAKPPESQITDADIIEGDTPKATFTPDVDGLYVFMLTVNDGKEDSEPDYVNIEATTPNVPPNAHAGEDENVYLGDTVSLDGSASEDPDGGPEPLTYQWVFASLPTNSALSDENISGADQPSASFVPDVVGQYVLTLVVSDGFAGDEDEVIILVSEPNVAPNARAGADFSIIPCETAMLDGSASDDPDSSPSALTYNWNFVSVPVGSALTNGDIVDADTATAYFIPDEAGSYVLELQVNDGADSDYDNVTVTVLSAAAVTYDGDMLLSTEGSPTIDAQLIATLRNDIGDVFVTDAEQVTFTLTAEGVGTIVATAQTQGGVASLTQTLEPAIYMVEITLGCFELVSEAIVVVYNVVTDLTARAKDGKVQLTWTHVGADSYNVYRKVEEGEYALIANTTSTYATFLDTEVSTGVTYSYVVKSVYNGVECDPSNEVSITPTTRSR